MAEYIMNNDKITFKITIIDNMSKRIKKSRRKLFYFKVKIFVAVIIKKIFKVFAWGNRNGL